MAAARWWAGLLPFWEVLLMVLNFVLFVWGLAVLLVGAELLVRGASSGARLLGVSPLVVGLTVVAFGTSSPELFVSGMSALEGQADVALGNVLGSNLFNVMVILGLAALVRPVPVDRSLLRQDVPLMVVASILTWIMALDYRISRLEGIVLAVGILCYTLYAVLTAKRSKVLSEDGGADRSRPAKGLLKYLALIVVGFIMLVLGSQWMLEGAVAVARAAGLSELVIGLTLIAAGTSMPELATTVVAAVRGESGLAVGNVVGSSIFNILAVLGTAAILAEDGVAVSPQVLGFDLPLMVAVAVACLPMFYTGLKVSRSEGALLFGSYVLYVVYVILVALSHPLESTFRTIVGHGIVPGGALLLSAYCAVEAFRYWKGKGTV